jgi:hypothetical protein
MGYAELLKDPRWQKKRLEIMERDNWTCQDCNDTESTLTVHHKSYRREDGEFVAIWDYPDTDLITLCEECHRAEESRLRTKQSSLYFFFRDHTENHNALVALQNVVFSLRNDNNGRLSDSDIIDVYATYNIFKAIKAKERKTAWFKRLALKITDRFNLAMDRHAGRIDNG